MLPYSFGVEVLVPDVFHRVIHQSFLLRPRKGAAERVLDAFVYCLFKRALSRHSSLRLLVLHPVVKMVSALAHTPASEKHAVHNAFT